RRLSGKRLAWAEPLSESRHTQGRPAPPMSAEMPSAAISETVHPQMLSLPSVGVLRLDPFLETGRIFPKIVWRLRAGNTIDTHERLSLCSFGSRHIPALAFELKDQRLRHSVLVLDLRRELPRSRQARGVESMAIFLECLVIVAKLQMLLTRQSVETREPR